MASRGRTSGHSGQVGETGAHAHDRRLRQEPLREHKLCSQCARPPHAPRGHPAECWASRSAESNQHTQPPIRSTPASGSMVHCTRARARRTKAQHPYASRIRLAIPFSWHVHVARLTLSDAPTVKPTCNPTRAKPCNHAVNMSLLPVYLCAWHGMHVQRSATWCVHLKAISQDVECLSRAGQHCDKSSTQHNCNVAGLRG